MARGKVRLSKAALATRAKFEESKHKRDASGKFADKPGVGDDAPKKLRAPKAAAEKPAPKYVGDKAEPFKAAGKVSGVKEDDIIVLHVVGNPKKAGSASALRYDNYRDEMTVGEYLKAVGKKDGLADIAWDRKKGFLSIHSKENLAKLKAGETVAPPVPKKAPVAEAKKQIKVEDLGNDDGLTLVATTTNPYKEGSMEWIKFKAFSMSPGKFLPYGAYKSTMAGSPQQKQEALQKLIDDGHVKVGTAAQKAAIAAVKAPHLSGISKVPLKDMPVWKSDDPRWSKAPAVALGTNRNTAEGRAALEAQRKSLGVHFVSANDNPSVRSYTGSGYQAINSRLRHGSDEEVLEYIGKSTHVKALDKLAAGQAAVVKADTYLYRGIGTHGNYGSKANLNDMPPPPDFVDKGYSSLSFNPQVSLGFAGTTAVGGNPQTAVFRVRVPKGARATHVGRMDRSQSDSLIDEAEVVAPRGTRYRFVSRTKETVPNIYGGPSKEVTVIEVEMVRADGSPF